MLKLLLSVFCCNNEKKESRSSHVSIYRDKGGRCEPSVRRHRGEETGRSLCCSCLRGTKHEEFNEKIAPMFSWPLCSEENHHGRKSMFQHLAEPRTCFTCDLRCYMTISEYRACLTSMRTGVQIPRTYAKRQAWLSMSGTLVPGWEGGA